MAQKEIKQKIVLEGEKQYNQAIREAQRNLKTLKSELKAETAELGRNATEQQKAEAKTKSLKAQIAEQEKVVKTLKDALAEVKEKYGDNAEEVARWEQRLNGARTTLANMKNDLEGVGSGFRTVNTDAAQATVATKSVADAIGSLAGAGEGVASAIENIFTGVIDVVTDAVGQLWDLISQTAAKANDWGDIAGYWGTDAQTIQQYARAVGANADSFEDLQGAVSRIVMGGKGKTIAELLGVSDVNYKNDWDYAMAVMDQMAALTESGKDMTPIYEQIFGEKRSQKVMDLVNDWRGIQEQLPTFSGGAYGMSDEGLQTMSDLWVDINRIEEKWDSLKSKIAEGFGVASLELLVNVEGTLDGIADYMNATDDAGREAALKKIRTNVEEFFTKLGEIIRDSIGILKEVGGSLQESDDPLTSAIGDILVKLSESLQWMVDHADQVKQAFETIFGVWLLAKLAAVAGKLSSILVQIKAVQAFSAISGAGAAAGSATAGASGGGFLAGVGGATAKAAPWVAGLGVLVKNAFTPQGNDDLWDENGNPTELGKELGYKTQAETEAEWKKHTPSVGERVDAGGIVSASQYHALNALWGNYSGQRFQNNSQERLLEAAQREFQGQEELLTEFLVRIRELQSSGNRPEDLPLEWFGVYGDIADQIEENIDLDEISDAAKGEAIQDWWDAWRNASAGTDTWDEEASAFEWMKEALGDEFGDVWDRIMQKLDETENQAGLEDLPEDWWRTTGSWSGGVPGENGVTSKDLEGLQSLPGNVETASERGVARGIRGIRVEIDGQSAGRILAPYISREIAKDIILQ